MQMEVKRMASIHLDGYSKTAAVSGLPRFYKWFIEFGIIRYLDIH
jgi:hypothetical protein